MGNLYHTSTTESAMAVSNAIDTAINQYMPTSIWASVLIKCGIVLYAFQIGRSLSEMFLKSYTVLITDDDGSPLKTRDGENITIQVSSKELEYLGI